RHSRLTGGRALGHRLSATAFLGGPGNACTRHARVRLLAQRCSLHVVLPSGRRRPRPGRTHRPGTLQSTQLVTGDAAAARYRLGTGARARRPRPGRPDRRSRSEPAPATARDGPRDQSRPDRRAVHSAGRECGAPLRRHRDSRRGADAVLRLVPRAYLAGRVHCRGCRFTGGTCLRSFPHVREPRRMSRTHGTAAWPMPLWSVLLPAFAITGVVGFGIVGLFDMPVGWPRVSAAFHDQLLLAGPIATLAAHFYCASLSGRRRLVALPSAPRVGHLSVLRSFALVLGWMLAAYLLPFVPLMVHTAVTESHGSIDLFAALAGPVGMCLSTALGCVAGTSFPRDRTSTRL